MMNDGERIIKGPPPPNPRLRDTTGGARRERRDNSLPLVPVDDGMFWQAADYRVHDGRPLEVRVVAMAEALLRVVATWGGIGSILYVLVRLFFRWAGV